MITHNNYKHQIVKVLQEEVSIGSNFGDFLALVNIAKEFSPLKNYNKENLMDLWKNYRINNAVQNHLRHNPFDFLGFSEIIGIENIISCFKQGGVFATFHFGHYRHVPFQLSQILNMNKENSIDIVVDQESYNSEMELTEWNLLREKYKVNYIISEEINSGLKLLRLLKQDKSFLLYLDGNTGAGNDSYPLEVLHITSITKIRSGIFRLLQLTNKPLCLLVSSLNSEEKPYLQAYKPIIINKENLEEAVNEIYSLFRFSLSERPELWRFWYRYHLNVDRWEEKQNTELSQPIIDWKSNNGLGVDLSTANVYKL